jgi:TIR domain
VPRIFVSYRREDSAASAGRLGDRLTHEFGDESVFMDVDSIPLGVDFVKLLADQVQTCDALLVVIGPTWSGIRDEDGERRLDDSNDFVRVEIRAALNRDIPVIPILLDGTKMPKAGLLPEDIKRLAVRNALDLRHNSFQKDLDRLIKELSLVLPTSLANRVRSIATWFSVVAFVLVAVVLMVLRGLPSLNWWVEAPASQVASSHPKLKPLAPINCEFEPKMFVHDTISPTTILFVNTGSATLRRYWLDETGKRVRYSDLVQSHDVAQETFVGHAWLIADEHDRCIAIYAAEDPTPSVVALK